MLRHMPRFYVYSLFSMHSGWRLAVPLLVLAALVLPGSGAARSAAAAYPLFYVGGNAHDLGQRDDLYFDLLELSSAGTPARITITTPAGYRVSPSYRPGFYFGDAEVYTNKGVYSGELDVAPKALFVADPSVAGCADGAHASDWLMLLKGSKGRLTVPVAVDRTASGLKLTVCLGAFNSAGLKIDEVYFVTRSVFRNPDPKRRLPLQRPRRPARGRRLSLTPPRSTRCAPTSRCPRT